MRPLIIWISWNYSKEIVTRIEKEFQKEALVIFRAQEEKINGFKNETIEINEFASIPTKINGRPVDKT